MAHRPATTWCDKKPYLSSVVWRGVVTRRLARATYSEERGKDEQKEAAFFVAKNKNGQFESARKGEGLWIRWGSGKTQQCMISRSRFVMVTSPMRILCGKMQRRVLILVGKPHVHGQTARRIGAWRGVNKCMMKRRTMNRANRKCDQCEIPQWIAVREYQGVSKYGTYTWSVPWSVPWSVEANKNRTHLCIS